MAFKIKIALTADLVDWMCVWVGTVFFNNLRKIIFLLSISPADWIVQTGAPGSDRGSDLFSCGAISPTFSLQCLRHFRCNASKIVVISSTFSLQCLRHFLSFCYLGVISQNMSRPFLSFLSLWNFHNQGSTSTLFNSSLVIEQQCSMWSCFPSFHLY